MRRHYVYYRVAPEALAAAVAAVTAMQAALQRAHPGLAAELLRRPGVRDGRVTLMEVYAFEGESIAAICEAAAREALAGLVDGERHVEVFESIG